MNESIYKLLLKEIPKDNIIINEPMKKHTSFKIGGVADFYVRAKSVDDVKYILSICNENNIPLTIVGNGSNLLVKDKGIRGIVVRIELNDIEINQVKNINTDTSDGINIKQLKNNNIKQTVDINTNWSEEIKKLEDIDNSESINKSNHVIVTVGCGVLLAKLAQILLKESIAGFEFASGIPGTIGGAIKMNAGAYGNEFKDIVVETTCITQDGEIIKLNNEEQKFEYRKSIFKEKKYIILETKLLLSSVDDESKIKEKMDEYKKSRQDKQPLNIPSAGSTFKRGEDFITAKLIDECGLKGYSIGGAQVSTKHAGFVVNTGNATASDVLQLVQLVKEKVLEKFNKNIELEVEVVGE